MKNKRSFRDKIASLMHHTGLCNLLAHARSNHWQILRYQRIVFPSELAYPLEQGCFVTPDTFHEHLLFLKRHCSILPLKELLSRFDSGKVFAPRSLVLTLEGGWSEHYSVAFPLLRELSIPATLCLPTKYLGQSDETFWTTRMAWFLCFFRKQIFEKREQTEELMKASALPTRLKAILLDTATLAPLELVLADLLRFLRLQKSEDRTRLLGLLAGFVPNMPPAPADYLKWEQVKEMSDSGLVSFVSNSHSLIDCTEANRTEIREDIQRSRDAFGANGINPLAVFCYPDGKSSEHAQLVLAQLRFTYVLSTSTSNDFAERPRVLGRLNIHDEATHTPPLFNFRLAVGG